MRSALLVSMVLAAVSCSSVSAIEFQLGRTARLKPGVYCPSETQVVVYDTRPETGISMHDMGPAAREMVRALGVRLVRHPLYWNRMETTDKPGVYDSKYPGRVD